MTSTPEPAGVPDLDWRALAVDGPAATAVLDGSRVRWASARATALAGGSRHGELCGAEAPDLLVPADRDRALRALERVRTQRVGSAVVRLRAAPGLRLEVALTGTPSGEVAVAAWDVTDRLARERTLAHRATHDRLTGLPNRALLADRWRSARERSRHTGSPTFLLVCDVDGLKDVNDLRGHRAGDDVLVQVARALTREVRPSDTVARLGGDEFVLLVEGVPTGDVERLCDRLRRNVLPSGGAPGRPVRLSVGWAVDDLDRPTESVLAEADARMYVDKQAARARLGGA
ncbi:GGDEF domain-containing protein [Kineococcus rubinsiae]|uniref:GGDEF domain-containing protein n=1 Tax=Kineococcus rubinsiae TaxID=2609562 RepID=UPI0014305D6C|nr:GGDEF domain-containing protein [Kineococcus rubinsiae]